MLIDHIGYLCKDINKSISCFEALGYEKISDIIYDNQPINDRKPRNVALCFLKNGEYMVELVSPLGKEDSVVAKQLQRQGEGPYHICYQTNQIEHELDQLKSDGWIVVQPLAPAVAFHKARVVFLFRSGVGLIEIVEINEMENII